LVPAVFLRKTDFEDDPQSKGATNEMFASRLGAQHGATDSSGVLAAYRRYFNRHGGVEVNYAWTLNTENYNAFGLNNNSHEISAAYVFRMDGLAGLNGFDRVTHRAEPSIGFGWRF
jgi:hypothetical protein